MDRELSHVLSDLRGRLSADGLVILRDLNDEESVGRLAAGIGRVRKHRDSARSGVTQIRPRPAIQPVSSAFGFGALPPHTDGSGVEQPADVVVTCVQEPAAAGGEALVADGAQVVAHIRRSDSELFEILCNPENFAFGPDSYRAPVIDRDSVPGGWRIRYREDGWLMAKTPGAVAALAAFHDAVAARTIEIPLSGGDAYVVDNLRYLHGRRAFKGDRVVVRYLIDTAGLSLGVKLTYI